MYVAAREMVLGKVISEDPSSRLTFHWDGGGEENLTTRLPGLSHDWIINVSIYMNTRLDL